MSVDNIPDKFPKQDGKDNTSSLQTLPVTDAVARTQLWCDFISQLRTQHGINKSLAQAFFVSKADIEALHNMFQADENIVGARMYIGMKQTISEIADECDMNLCLVAVEQPASGSQFDIVVSPDTGESLVFDFSRPCPSTCDVNSMLYHSENPSGYTLPME